VVDFSAVEKRRQEKGLSDNDDELRQDGPSNLIENLARQAKPIYDNLVLTHDTPKLTTQVAATATIANVVKAKTFTHREGAQHLMKIFVPPLDDISSFTAPVFHKTPDEKNLIREALKTSFVFVACSDRELRTIIDALEELSCRAGEQLIVEGDVGDYFYVLKTGTVRFEVNGKLKGHTQKGKTFGELALLHSTPREVSVTAETDITIYRVDRNTFRYIMHSQTTETEKAKTQLLQGVKFFDCLEPNNKNKLVHAMVPHVFEEGENVTQDGEEIAQLHVIQEGRIRVTNVSLDNEEKEYEELGPADHFGETSLLKGSSAKCPAAVALTRAVTLSIDKDTFEKAIGDVAELIIHAKEKHALESIPILKRMLLSKPTFDALAAKTSELHYPPNHTIMTEGEKTYAKLYIIRSGGVILKSKSNDEEKVIQAGGYFGENMLNIDTDGLKETTFYDAEYTITTLDQPIVVGELTIDSCRRLFDTTMEGTQRAVGPISLHDLKKHTILGAGSYGQVWLVSYVGADGERRPYALKIQSKHELLEANQAAGAIQEKYLMEQLNHPFLAHLAATYQDEKCIYMLLGFVQGGELYSVVHSNTGDGIEEKKANFYASAILEGLSYMHRRHVVYGDLKPENIMIDQDGYPVIVDFGFAERVTTKSYNMCGTLLYMAPEKIQERGHDKGADHWSFGVLVYEMTVGRTPFYKKGMNKKQMYEAILTAQFEFPPEGTLSPELKNLLRRLFVVNPTERIGSLAGGINDIYAHPWFEGVDFGKLRQKEIEAPWLPEVKDPLDTTNFESWDHLKDATDSEEKVPTKGWQQIFKTF